MSSAYTPDGSTWEPLVTIATSSDNPNSGVFQASDEGNADRSQYLYNHATNIQTRTLNTAGTTTITFATDVVVRVFGCGGGGGGKGASLYVSL